MKMQYGNFTYRPKHMKLTKRSVFVLSVTLLFACILCLSFASVFSQTIYMHPAGADEEKAVNVSAGDVSSDDPDDLEGDDEGSLDEEGLQEVPGSDAQNDAIEDLEEDALDDLFFEDAGISRFESSKAAIGPFETYGQVKASKSALSEKMSALSTSASDDASNSAPSAKREIFVDNEGTFGGSDSNSGTLQKPVKTLKAAYALLQDASMQDDVSDNRIYLMSDYAQDDKQAWASASDADRKKYFNRPATISGISVSGDSFALDPKVIIYWSCGANGLDDGKLLFANTAFENLVFKGDATGAVYCQCNDLTMGENITMKGYSKKVDAEMNPSGLTASDFHIYGGYLNWDKAGKDNSELDKAYTICIQSGSYIRVLAGSRNSGDIDQVCKVSKGVFGSARYHVQAKIKIDIKESSKGQCQADVANIYGGQCGGTFYGLSTIEFTKENTGTVGCVVGGNALVDATDSKFENAPNDFIGQVKLSIKGGIVGAVYGGCWGPLDDQASEGITRFLANNHVRFSETSSDIAIYIGTKAHVKDAIADVETVNADGNVYGAGVASITKSDPSNIEAIEVAVSVTSKGKIDGNVYGAGTWRATEASSPFVQNTKAAVCTGNTIVCIKGGTVKGSVYGAGAIIGSLQKTKYGKWYTDIAALKGNAKTVVLGGIIKGNVYGGGYNARVEGDTTVEYTGGTIAKSLFGAGRASTSAANKSLVAGASAISIKGVRDSKNTGSDAYQDLASIQDADQILVSNSTLRLTGASVGAGSALVYSIYNVGNLELKDNTLLQLDADIDCKQDPVCDETSSYQLMYEEPQTVAVAQFKPNNDATLSVAAVPGATQTVLCAPGKHYAGITERDTTTITSNSSWTAEFITSYVPADFVNQTNANMTLLPYRSYTEIGGTFFQFFSGTTITMVDLTYPSEPQYYYYKVEGTNDISLTSFRNMATGENFRLHSENTRIQERLVFIFDYENANWYTMNQSANECTQYVTLLHSYQYQMNNTTYNQDLIHEPVYVSHGNWDEWKGYIASIYASQNILWQATYEKLIDMSLVPAENDNLAESSTVNTVDNPYLYDVFSYTFNLRLPTTYGANRKVVNTLFDGKSKMLTVRIEDDYNSSWYIPINLPEGFKIQIGDENPLAYAFTQSNAAWQTSMMNNPTFYTGIEEGSIPIKVYVPRNLKYGRFSTQEAAHGSPYDKLRVDADVSASAVKGYSDTSYIVKRTNDTGMYDENEMVRFVYSDLQLSKTLPDVGYQVLTRDIYGADANHALSAAAGSGVAGQVLLWRTTAPNAVNLDHDLGSKASDVSIYVDGEQSTSVWLTKAANGEGTGLNNAWRYDLHYSGLSQGQHTVIMYYGATKETVMLTIG